MSTVDTERQQEQAEGHVPDTRMNTGPSQAPQGGDYGDSSAQMWSLSISEGEKYDKALAESWKGNMDGILIFTGLFSASVSAFIIEAYKNLNPDSGDTTVILLQQISQQFAAYANGTPIAPPQDVAQRPFKPSASMLRVNIWWFLSLVLSVCCALAATLVQQWTRKYLQTAQLRSSPQSRARIRTHLYQGVVSFRMSATANTIPFLLHASVFLFFAGLIEFLFDINLTAAYVIVAAVGVFALVYILLTILPIVYRNCPYQTPLSTPLWRSAQSLVVILLSLFQRVLSVVAPYSRLSLLDLPEYAAACQKRLLGGLRQNIEQSASETASEVDHTALRLTLRSLRDDHEFEPFVEGIPGFVRSHVVEGGSVTIWRLLRDRDVQLGTRIGRLLRSCTGTALGGLTEAARCRRALTCLDAIWCLTKWFEVSKIRSWDLDFGDVTVRALGMVKKEADPNIAVSARCTAALGAHVLLNELPTTSLNAQRAELRTVIVALMELPPGLQGTFISPGGLPHDRYLLLLIDFLSGVLPYLESLNDRSLVLVWDTLGVLLTGLESTEVSPSIRIAFIGLWREIDNFTGEEQSSVPELFNHWRSPSNTHTESPLSSRTLHAHTRSELDPSRSNVSSLRFPTMPAWNNQTSHTIRIKDALRPIAIALRVT
ncbi:hypothetical protein BV25DRAFT_1819519 [Artomyces pyxidatus]|uniref:Uncharacterized protein n=1 Tax=Artomyces pyxidatus TaxID=48021 RepID=A0ACB8TFM1_9AGAM|nr:hypothetical protein BV25DRAFT_1819519 [Artomyces pyxidatus]